MIKFDQCEECDDQFGNECFNKRNMKSTVLWQDIPQTIMRVVVLAHRWSPPCYNCASSHWHHWQSWHGDKDIIQKQPCCILLHWSPMKNKLTSPPPLTHPKKRTMEKIWGSVELLKMCISRQVDKRDRKNEILERKRQVFSNDEVKCDKREKGWYNKRTLNYLGWDCLIL